MPVSKVGNPSTIAQKPTTENSTALGQLLESPTAPEVSERSPKHFLTIADAADRLGLNRAALERCVRRGDVPHYTFFNSRKLVRVSEIEAFVLTSRKGGE